MSQLTDSFIELIGATVSFKEIILKRQPTYEEIRSLIIRLIQQSEKNALEKGIPQTEYDRARYAIFAWIDETILAAAWDAKIKWRSELLQRIYFNSADAGEKFFERLDALEPHQKDIREIFYLCLSLGFKGRYCGPGDEEKLNLVKQRQLKLLFDGAVETPTFAVLEKERIFPFAYSKNVEQGTSPKKERKYILAAFWIVPALITGTLFLAFHFALSNVAENILKTVR